MGGLQADMRQLNQAQSQPASLVGLGDQGLQLGAHLQEGHHVLTDCELQLLG